MASTSSSAESPARASIFICRCAARHAENARPSARAILSAFTPLRRAPSSGEQSRTGEFLLSPRCAQRIRSYVPVTSGARDLRIHRGYFSLFSRLRSAFRSIPHRCRDRIRCQLLGAQRLAPSRPAAFHILSPHWHVGYRTQTLLEV